jgi:hypothetical protein
MESKATFKGGILAMYGKLGCYKNNAISKFLESR